jgi:pimeloyl-ACP methyl ester carboxylesterase
VVIEPGIGNAREIWEPVVNALEGDMRIVLYDRAGYGQSDPGPMPRTAERVAGELNTMLEKLPGVDPPYIVVGHSIGCINALVYSSEHANEVEGLVLLDPPPVDFIRGRRFPELRAKADSMTAGFRMDAERARAGGDERLAIQDETIASEHEQMFETGGTWVEAIPSLGATPLVVVASGVPNPQFEPYADEFQQFWKESSEKLTALSVRGEFLYAENSTHDLPGDATATVVEAIHRAVSLSEEPLEPTYYPGDK